MENAKYFETFLSKRFEKYDKGDYTILVERIINGDLTELEHKRLIKYVETIEEMDLDEYRKSPMNTKLDFVTLAREVYRYKFNKAS